MMICHCDDEEDDDGGGGDDDDDDCVEVASDLASSRIRWEYIRRHSLGRKENLLL